MTVYVLYLVLAMPGHTVELPIDLVYTTWHKCDASAKFFNGNNTNPTTELVCREERK